MASNLSTLGLGFETSKIEVISSVQPIVIPEIIVEDKVLNNLYANLLSIVDDEALSRSDKQSKLIESIKQIPVTHFYTVLTNIATWIEERTVELKSGYTEQDESTSERLQSLMELQQVVSLGISAQLTGLLTGKLIEEHNAINRANNLLQLRGKEFLVMIGVVLTAIALMLAFQGYKSYQEELEHERQEALGLKAEFDRGEDILAELEL